MRYAVLKGISEHRSVALSAARADGVYSLDDKRLGIALGESIRGEYKGRLSGDFLSIGNMGDFLGGRLGYGEKDMMIDLNYFRKYLVSVGVSDEEIVKTGWSSLLMNPLAVLKTPRRPDHLIVVVDKHVSGIDGVSPSFISFAIPLPESSKDMKFISVSPWRFYDNVLLTCLEHPGNWVYMKPGEGEGQRYVLVDKLIDLVEKGMRLEGPFKKIGAMTSPVFDSGSRSKLLNIANIASFFENTKLFVEKESNFVEDGLKEVLPLEKIEPEDESVEEAVQEEPVKEASPREESVKTESGERLDAAASSVSLQDKMNVRIGCGFFSKSERDALAVAGIRTAGDIMRVGFRGVYEATGKVRTMNKAAHFLENNGIFLVSKSQLESTPSLSREEVGSHMLEAVLAYSGKDLPVVKPQRLDGRAFDGGDTLHLVASMALEKRNACSVWVTERELGELGCGIGKASPVPVTIDGELTRVYNLSSTTFPKMHKEAYQDFVEALSEGADCGTVGKYFKSFLWSVSGADMGSYENLVKSFNENTSERVNQLRESRSVSLEDVIGINGIKQMKRVAKSVRMYQELSRVSAGIKLKK